MRRRIVRRETAAAWAPSGLAFAAALIGLGIAQCRAQTPDGGQALSPASQAVLRLEAVLTEPTELEFVETPLADVVTYVADLHQCTVLIDEAGLAESGLDAQSIAVTGALRDLSLASALYHLLRPHGLGFGISHEALVLTSEDAAASLTYLRCYPLGELVERWPNATAALGTADGGMGGGGGGFFQVTEDMADMAAMGGVTEGLFATPPVGEDLLNLITSCVAPDRWASNGGLGTIAYAPPARLLVVSQNYAVQAEVQTLLQQLRQAVEANPVPMPTELPVEGSVE